MVYGLQFTVYGLQLTDFILTKTEKTPPEVLQL